MRGNGHRHRGVPRERQVYYWVCAVDKVTGRPVILGPYTNESEANQFGFQKISDGDFVVEAMDTRDRQAAKARFNYKRLEQTGQLEVALKRAKYKV